MAIVTQIRIKFKKLAHSYSRILFYFYKKAALLCFHKRAAILNYFQNIASTNLSDSAYLDSGINEFGVFCSCFPVFEI